MTANPAPRTRYGSRLLSALGPLLMLLFVVVLFSVMLAIQDVREQAQRKERKGWAGFQQTVAELEWAPEQHYQGLKAFLSGRNYKTVLTQTVIVALGALGMTMIIVSGGIDLSVGSIVALGSVVG